MGKAWFTLLPEALEMPQTEAGLTNWFDSVETWIKEIRDGSLEVSLSDETVDALQHDGSWPTREVVAETLENASVDWLSINDVQTVLFSFVERCSSLEAQLNCTDVLATWNSFPFPQNGASKTDRVNEHITSIAGVAGSSGIRIPSALITNATRGCQGSFALQGVLEIAECFSAPDPVWVTDLSCTVNFARIGSGDYYAALGQLLELPITSEQFCAAVRLQARHAGFELSKFTLHSTFIEQALAEQALTAALLEKLIRSCAEVASGAVLRKSHPLRRNKGGGSEDLKDGEATAMRHDVDREWHLHYWNGGNGEVQLAAVVKHNNFKIPNREPST